MDYTIIGLIGIVFIICVGNYLLTIKEKKVLRDKDE